MSTSFPSAPSPYSISPDAYVALSKLNLSNPGQASGQPVSSYGLTQGQPAVQSNTQAALQQALSNALSGNSLQSLVQSLISNPAAAQSYAGSVSPSYTPQQPSNAWRLNTSNGSMSPLFPGGTVNPIVAPTPAAQPTQAPSTPVQQLFDPQPFWSYAGP